MKRILLFLLLCALSSPIFAKSLTLITEIPSYYGYRFTISYVTCRIEACGLPVCNLNSWKKISVANHGKRHLSIPANSILLFTAVTHGKKVAWEGNYDIAYNNCNSMNGNRVYFWENQDNQITCVPSW